MFTLLPENEKKSILREYKTRRAVVICAFVFVLGVVASVSLFPSYLLSSARVKEVENQLSRVRQSAILNEADTLDKAVLQTNKKIDSLQFSTSTVFVENLFKDIASRRGDSIRLRGFQYKRGAGKDAGVLSISGVARDRESLLQFTKSLEENPSFDQINLPVSNFARDKNAEFTIEVRGKF